MGNNFTIDDIFNDDNFGILNSNPQKSNLKTDDDRLIESFEEINAFVDKYKKEPSTGSMSEYRLLANLKTFRQDEVKKRTLKPFDRHNLLGHVEMEKQSIDDILNEDDDLLKTDEELSIFRFKHIPNPDDRAETDYVAQRKPMKEKYFRYYDELFQNVHKEIKEGRRRIVPFVNNIEDYLKKGHFYIVDGIMCYLEEVIFERKNSNLSIETVRRKDGRTRTIFENGTYSNMLYRSLGKQIQKNGKLITNTNEYPINDLFVNTSMVKENDVHAGIIYILKSKSKNPIIAEKKDLFKIGFSKTSIDERIRNAKNEATYLFADVIKIRVYQCYNRNAAKLEQLIHRFFAEVCLDVDLFDDDGQRITPREWFVAPLEIIEEAIPMILNESIVNYKYDKNNKKIILKQ